MTKAGGAMSDSINSKRAGELFHVLVDKFGKDDLNAILDNWNESELNEDGTEILIYVDSRAYGPRTGGAD